MASVPYTGNADASQHNDPSLRAVGCEILRDQVPVPSTIHLHTAPPVAPETLDDCEEEDRPLNRIREVREQQGVSIRSMSRRLGLDVKTCRKLEDPERDLTLSELQSIQEALDVPLQDLLVDRQSLSRPVQERAKMIRIMKTAVALKDLKMNARAERMTEMLCEQLVDIMPELAEVSGWPQFGARRGKSALGRVLAQQIDMSQFNAE